MFAGFQRSDCECFSLRFFANVAHLVSYGRLDPKVHHHLLTRVGNRFVIPFMFSMILGLAAVALRDDPVMRALLPKDASAGLPVPSAASAAVLVVLCLVVTSGTSVELIAVSSILTYDVYEVIISL